MNAEWPLARAREGERAASELSFTSMMAAAAAVARQPLKCGGSAAGVAVAAQFSRIPTAFRSLILFFFFLWLGHHGSPLNPLLLRSEFVWPTFSIQPTAFCLGILVAVRKNNYELIQLK